MNREIVFGDVEKERFLKIVRRQLEFSGLECLAWCVMGNHFHLLLRVPDKESALVGWSEGDFIARLAVLSEESYTRELLKKVEMWRSEGCGVLITELAAKVRKRLFDLSSFMKEVKQKFSAWFNFVHGRKGTLWEDRFRSVLVEGTGGWSADGLSGLLAVAAYIDLNPVRAGIVDDPKDYRWCSYGAAVAGGQSARGGLAICAGFAPGTAWSKVGAAYRKVVFAAGVEEVGGVAPDGATHARRGFTKAQIEAVWKAGGRLSLGAVLRCRVAFFTEGLAIGGRGFLESLGREGGGDWARESRVEGADLAGLVICGSRRADAIRAPS